MRWAATPRTHHRDRPARRPGRGRVAHARRRRPASDAPLTAVIEMSARRRPRPRSRGPGGDDPVRATTRPASASSSWPPATRARAASSIGCGGSATTDGGVGRLRGRRARPAALRGRRARRRLRRHHALSSTPPPSSARRRAPRRHRSCSSAGASPRSRPATDARPASTSPPSRAPAPPAGLAGGLVALGARIEPGFDFVAGLVGLAERLERADLVVTGEGHLDPPSFHGKVPGGVLELARARGGTGGPSRSCASPAAPTRRCWPRRPPGLEVVSLTARFGRARARSETARADRPGHRRGAAPVLPLNEPIGHTAGAPRRPSAPPAGPSPSGTAGRGALTGHREASPWDCSTARWRSSPAQDEASGAKRHSCSPARAPGSSSTTSAPGCTARASQDAHPAEEVVGAHQGERRRRRGQRRRHQHVGRRQERRRPGDRHLRLARHPGQQRRDPARQDVLQHGRVGLGRRDPGPPQGPLRRHPPRRRVLAQPGQVGRGRHRPHHQHVLGGRPLRQRRPGQLRRGQGGHRRAHLGRGPRARPLRRHVQRHRAPGPHPHDRDHLRRRRHERRRGRLRRLGPQEHRQRGGASWPRPPRPTSPGRSSSSSAATSTP